MLPPSCFIYQVLLYLEKNKEKFVSYGKKGNNTHIFIVVQQTHNATTTKSENIC